MSFGRHRLRNKDVPPTKKVSETSKEITEGKHEPVNKNSVHTNSKAIDTEEKEEAKKIEAFLNDIMEMEEDMEKDEEKTVISETTKAAADPGDQAAGFDIKKNEVIKEEIKPLQKKEKKKREDKKKHVSVGIMGDTIEVRDFRAICKKAGKQINIELIKILKDWNMANYNL